MRIGGRVNAAIEILQIIQKNHIPASIALKNWGINNRFAGANDRSVIGNLIYDALRKKNLFAYLQQDDSARAILLNVLVRDWGEKVDKLNEQFLSDKFAPAPISAKEKKLLEAKIKKDKIPDHIIANFPHWLEEPLKNIFASNFVREGEYFAKRAPIDIRVNSLKSTVQKVQKSLMRFQVQNGLIVKTALRIETGKKQEKSPNITASAAYQKGWFEVQDLGSQIVSFLIGAKAGEQILDYCAGAGGKTLALAANMQNRGQIFAYDNDRERLKPIYERLRRNGVRNVQIIAPDNNMALDSLVGKIDRLVIDAPCTGSGTWRRRPDIKWKLNQNRLNEKIKQQREILENSKKFVKKGGQLAYISCSILQQENDEQIEQFLRENKDFTLKKANIFWQEHFPLEQELKPYFTQYGLILSPASCQTDGFYISILERSKNDN